MSNRKTYEEPTQTATLRAIARAYKPEKAHCMKLRRLAKEARVNLQKVPYEAIVEAIRKSRDLY